MSSSSGKDYRLIQNELYKNVLKLFIDKQIENKDDVDWKIIAYRIGGSCNPNLLLEQSLEFTRRRSKN